MAVKARLEKGISSAVSKTISGALTNTISGFSRLRSSLYTIEGLPVYGIQRLLQGRRDHIHDVTLQEYRIANRRMTALFKEDARLFLGGVYPKKLLIPESPLQHFNRFRQILTDSVWVALRKRNKEHHALPIDKGVPRQDYPDYYLRNYHFQTGGYLTDRSAELYDHQVEILFRGTAAAMRRMVIAGLYELDEDLRGATVLDLACGDGSSTEVLALRFPHARITAIDLSPHYLERTKKRLSDFSNIDYVETKAEELVFRDSSFDVVCSTYLFHEVPRTIRRQILTEVRRVLKPGGLFACLDSIQIGDVPELDFLIKKFPIHYHEPFFRDYIENIMEELTEQAGFEREIKKISFITKGLFVRKPKA